MVEQILCIESYYSKYSNKFFIKDNWYYLANNYLTIQKDGTLIRTVYSVYFNCESPFYNDCDIFNKEDFYKIFIRKGQLRENIINEILNG